MYNILSMHGMYMYLYAFICVLMPMYHNNIGAVCRVCICVYIYYTCTIFIHNYMSDLYYVTVSALYIVWIYTPTVSTLKVIPNVYFLVEVLVIRYWLT